MATASEAKTETDAEKEVREAEEARVKYEAAQAKVVARQNAERDAALAPYKTLVTSAGYAKVEDDITRMFTTDGVMTDRSLYQQLQTTQDAMRLLRESTTSRTGTAT